MKCVKLSCINVLIRNTSVEHNTIQKDHKLQPPQNQINNYFNNA